MVDNSAHWGWWRLIIGYIYCNCKYFLSCHNKRFCWFLNLLIWNKNLDRSWCDLTICTLFIRTKYWHFTFILYSLYIPQFHHSHLGLWVCSKNLVEKFNCSIIIFLRSSQSKEVEDWTLYFDLKMFCPSLKRFLITL
jgi:hypothetical protein